MWQPLRQLPFGPGQEDALLKIGSPNDRIESWANETYHVIARHQTSGVSWLSIKRHDRQPIMPWRHMQQMKNEVCGPEREGIELYPAESRLADNANEYHLWVFPEGYRLPLGFPEGMVTTDDQVRRFNDAPHNGRQTPWEPGLTTGRNEDTPYMTDELEAQVPGDLLVPKGDTDA
jgi:hypothetical protein